MSSHREAPEISKDPAADSTDVYAFVSPDRPTHVTIIANYIPLQPPQGGPNFYEFDDDVVYDIKINNGHKDNSWGHGHRWGHFGKSRHKEEADIIYRFRFSTQVRTKSFLYNTGQITDIKGTEWNRPQSYTVTMIKDGHEEALTPHPLMCPPVNVGPRSTPNYNRLADQATYAVGKRSFFAGQRADAFHVDLGSVFDLGGLRPLNPAHLIPLAAHSGVNGLQAFNVHTLAIQVPITDITRNNQLPSDVLSPDSVIGVWTTASRRGAQIFSKKHGRYVGVGRLQAVSRLANPLFNEVLVPIGLKDLWNSVPPTDDDQFATYVTKPELAGLLPVLYPGAFPNLAAYDKPRNDLAAILLTGIPAGVVKNADGDTIFQNFTGSDPQDLLRLNLAVPPTQTTDATYSVLGVVGGDLAGFPNGRRPADDVVTIELQAIAGLTIPLVDPTFTPDAVVPKVSDGTTNTNAKLRDKFPYLGLPGGGYQTAPGQTKASDNAPDSLQAG